MFEYIRGGLSNKYTTKKGCFVVLDVNGIGFAVEVMKKDYDKININQVEARLYTVLIHREDSMSLCGFLDMEVRNVFNVLVQVSGVGTRMALNLLNQFELKHLINCVVQEKEKELTMAKGVGLKLAQKIIIELRDKFINVELENDNSEEISDEFEDVKNMLLQLQYTEEEICKAHGIVAQMNTEIKNSEDMLREILKVLSA